MNLEACIATRAVPLDVDLALSGQGIPAGGRPGERVMAAARSAVAAAGHLVVARFVRAIAPIVAHRRAAVELAAGSLEGEAIAAALEGAEYVVSTVCTIGARLEARVSALLPSDPLGALAYDGLGSAACERFAGELCAEIEEQVAAERVQVTGPLAPGMIGWSLLEAQRQVFALVDPAPIGVVLTPYGQMLPRKSLSFVIGLGPHVKRQAKCSVCAMRDRCKFRGNHA